MTRTPAWLWVVLSSPLPPSWYAVMRSGPGVDDRAFFWVGIGAALPLVLYGCHRLLKRAALSAQRRWILPQREEA